jgi:Holliday junction resolvasome RuvABC endonuclease subunit
MPMSTEPQVLGLDLSLNATGVCLPDGMTYTIKCKASQGDSRFTLIRDHLRVTLRYSRPDIAVVEDLGRFKGNTLIVMAMVRACAVLELLDSGVPYVFVSPTSLKMFATGSGRADKDDMARAAADRGGRTFADDNQCDAWWLRAAALCTYGNGAGLVLDVKQRGALEAIGWPDVQRATDAAGDPETAVQRSVLTPGCPACEGWGHIHKGCVLR